MSSVADHLSSVTDSSSSSPPSSSSALRRRVVGGQVGQVSIISNTDTVTTNLTTIARTTTSQPQSEEKKKTACKILEKQKATMTHTLSESMDGDTTEEIEEYTALQRESDSPTPDSSPSRVSDKYFEMNILNGEKSHLLDENPVTEDSSMEIKIQDEESFWSIYVSVFIPFLIAGVGMVGAGLVLDIVQHWEVFRIIQEIYILVPALLGLKGM